MLNSQYGSLIQTINEICFIYILKVKSLVKSSTNECADHFVNWSPFQLSILRTEISTKYDTLTNGRTKWIPDLGTVNFTNT